MKSNIFSIVALLFSAQLFAEKPLVVATTTMIADMAQNIAGEHLQIRSLMPVGGDPHLYEPTPSDAVMVSNAQLLLRNGLSLEGWLDPILQNAGGKSPLITVSEGVVPIQSTDHHGAPDPHAWMDVRNVMLYADNIAAAFVRLDPAHAETYRKNLAAYRAQLQDLEQFVREQTAKIPAEQRVIITSHDAFHYFANAYGFTVDATMGTSTDADVRTADVSRLGSLIKSRGLKAIFVESTVNPKLLEQLARDFNIKIGGELYADSLGEPNTESGTYIGMIRYNTQVIVNGLSGGNTGNQQPVSNALGLWPFLALGALVLLGLAILLRNAFRKDDYYAES